YRKERTGNLDENEIRSIIEFKNKQENLYNAKVTAINGIEELGKMTPELMENIVNAKTLKEVEELYKPYKSKKKTKAMIALEKGFGVVAEILKLNKIEIPDELLKDYSREEIIDGAIEIVGAEVNANSTLRHGLIENLNHDGVISSKIKGEKALEKLNEKDKEQISKFEIYKDFQINLSQIKPYQVLALNRGEKLGILTVKIEKDDEIYESLEDLYGDILQGIKDPETSSGGQYREQEGQYRSQGGRISWIPELREGVKRGYENLFASVENEIRGDKSEIGEDDSIKVFQTNLEALLLTKPEKVNSLLSIDPGFRVGCKLCVLNELGNPVYFDKIYLHNLEDAKKKLSDVIKKYKIEVVVIGNGTGSKETSTLISEVFDKDIFIVNESGASVYSVSKVAEEEFPNLDSLDRGTISIGRRFIDPLSELVKIPVGSIGVGMYQHDMPEKKLEQKLGYVVESAVNEVGINVNTASVYVLNHISGIDKRQAKKIYEKRPYRSRAEIKKVLSDKAYEQAIGFLRVPESKEELDNTDIHPDQYALARYIIGNSKIKVDDEMKKLYPDVTSETIKFILSSYNNLGKEKRVNSTHSKAKNNSKELLIGDIIEGIVRNVVAFGAFVDIGTKNDGLVHISHLSNSYVTNPMDVVKVGDKVKVRVLNIDDKGKIQLSMKEI
ncbi:MAG: Tex-like N-terminal domain-containing protein, partial [Candidatus Gracilibacteria bacterium]|nr:Tex-like N-terminal domain-containing protein [Candidatus Gracilibacteria bacterium]